MRPQSLDASGVCFFFKFASFQSRARQKRPHQVTRRQPRLMCKPQCTPPHPTEQPRPGAPPSCVAEYATTSHEHRIGFLLFAGSRQPVGSPGRFSLLRTHVSLRRRIDSKRGTPVAPCSRCPAQIKSVSGPSIPDSANSTSFLNG